MAPFEVVIKIYKKYNIKPYIIQCNKANTYDY